MNKSYSEVKIKPLSNMLDSIIMEVVKMYMSYDEYLEKIGKKNCRQSWVDWKVEICGMDEAEAIQASYYNLEL